jgi:hypothetical protein
MYHRVDTTALNHVLLLKTIFRQDNTDRVGGAAR